MFPQPISPVGVGLPYIAGLPAELYRAGLVDFVEIAPETICRQRSVRNSPLIELVPEQMKRARDIVGAFPLAVHGVELSIGSVHGCNDAYLDMLDQFQSAWPFLWHSEHLGFQTIPGENNATLQVGVPLPLPPVIEAAAIVAERSAAIGRRYGVPFLLENAAFYLPDLPADPELGDDIGLINAITQRSGCFLLLDLHNVYCNCINHGGHPMAAIDRMPLSRVLEIHVAGGSWREGFWMDAHDGRVPERVWEMLAYTLPRAANVAGVVFEMLDEHALRLNPAVIEDELRRAREIWDLHRCR